MLAVLLMNRMRSRRQKLTKHKLKNRIFNNNHKVSEYCRTCLSREDLVSIFYNRETAGKRTEEFQIVTGLQIKMNDGLSQKICTNCIESMNQALQFRIKSVENDRILREKLHNDENNDSGMKSLINNDYMMTNSNSDDYLSVELDSDFDNECYLSVAEDCNDYFDDSCDLETIQTNKKTSPHREKKEVISEHKCEVCSKVYNKKSSLRAHMKKHTNFIVCEECGKQCGNTTMLLQHKRALHGLERVHVCEKCDYSSATKAGLITHSRLHTGERPYVCEHCAAAFHSRASLVQHLPIHLPESKFQCTICHKREKSKRLLQHHHYKVHRPKRHRYLCPVCGDAFKSPGSARHHLTVTHGVPRSEQPVIQRTEIVPEETMLEENSFENYLQINT